MALQDMVNEIKRDAAPLAPSAGEAPSSPAGLLFSYSQELTALSPAQTLENGEGNTYWFHEPTLAHIEECEHCRAQSSIISSGYGPRRDPKGRGSRFHHGIDIRAPRGSAVMAYKGGVVIHAARFSSYGLTVEIQHYDGMVSRYAHLNAIKVSKGQAVAAGELIGEVGSTGRTTGVHLHFELRKDGKSVNPHEYLARIEQVMRCKQTGLAWNR